MPDEIPRIRSYKIAWFYAKGSARYYAQLYDSWWSPYDDLMVEAELAVWVAWKQCRSERSFMRYARKCIRTAIWMYLRKHRPKGQDLVFDDQKRVPDDGNLRSIEHNVIVAEVMGRCSLEQAVAIRMRLEGAPWPEIGVALGVSRFKAYRDAKAAFDGYTPEIPYDTTTRQR